MIILLEIRGLTSLYCMSFLRYQVLPALDHSRYFPCFVTSGLAFLEINNFFDQCDIVRDCRCFTYLIVLKVQEPYQNVSRISYVYFIICENGGFFWSQTHNLRFSKMVYFAKIFNSYNLDTQEITSKSIIKTKSSQMFAKNRNNIGT